MLGAGGQERERKRQRKLRRPLHLSEGAGCHTDCKEKSLGGIHSIHREGGQSSAGLSGSHKARWVAHEPVIPALRVLRQEDCEIRPELYNEVLSKKTKTQYVKTGLKRRRS